MKILIGSISLDVNEDPYQTLGAGRFVDQGDIDGWSDLEWKRIFTAAGYTARPFNRKLARGVMQRLIQAAHRKAAGLEIPAAWPERDAREYQKYLAGLSIDAGRKSEAGERLKKSGSSFAKKDLTYTRSKILLKQELKGQQQLVQAWFRKTESGTAERITADLVAAGFTCNQDPQRAIYYYLNEWKKKGWVTV